ncbi:sialic acid binding Ig-like lectin 15, like isoform X9 [Synchiropus splendidus]|uniref:sialic acid binding Ig-like lectin 15, like isoform X9 n=1 Tax=Synchiropus splendidus TaxID=270530 RepID=UPI00237EB35B|nr:sialic acid binding Ig-like lectin 15, like isoform X9 [Synchiropus splendidus]
MKMKPLQTFLLLVTAAAAASRLPINMSVSEKVLAARGDDALLSCSFTHPRQSSYSGRINVTWLTIKASSPPFFTCSIHNSSDADVSKCSLPGYKYTLAGDPRQGVLTLLIRNLTLADERKYFCRVELEDGGDTRREIDLRVGEKPLILSLKEMNRTQNRRSLECVVEGNPLPTVTWFSKSKQQSQDPIGTEPSGMFQVTSWVSFHEDDRLTCQAENPLGRAEQTYPEESSLVLIISVCVTGVLLLLLVIGLVVCRTLRRAPPPDVAPVYENPNAPPPDVAPVYENPNEAQNYQMKHLDSSSPCVYVLAQPVSIDARMTRASAGESDVYYSTVEMSE